jgi:hypothetical protein
MICSHEGLWRRPKDLAGRTKGLDRGSRAGSVVPESRSFGRAQLVVYLQVRRALPQEIKALVSEARTLQHTLRACRSPRSWSGPTILKIAHRVIRTTGSGVVRKIIRRSASLPRKRGWASCRTSLPRPFPTSHAGSCLVSRAPCHPPPSTRLPTERQGKRHGKPPCPPCPPCETQSFCGCRSASSLEKTRMGILPHFPPSPVPTSHAGSCLVGRAPCHPPSSTRLPTERQGKRHGKPPCPPCPPCETQSFCGAGISPPLPRRQVSGPVRLTAAHITAISNAATAGYAAVALRFQHSLGWLLG